MDKDLKLFSESGDIGAVEVHQGEIIFSNFEDMKRDVTVLADKIYQMDITESNLQDAKKVMANVRKGITALNNERKRIKQSFLQPLTVFETQIKEIEAIVKSAEDCQRDKIREFDELERDAKKEAIKIQWEQFGASSTNYDTVMDKFTFADFYREELANKSTTQKKINSYITTWFTVKATDLSVLESMNNDVITNLYLKDGMELSDAILKAKELTENQDLDEQKSVEVVDFSEPAKSKTYSLLFNSLEDFAEAKRLLTINNINYKEEQ